MLLKGRGDVQSAMTMELELTTWRHCAEELMLIVALMMAVVVGCGRPGYLCA